MQDIICKLIKEIGANANEDCLKHTPIRVERMYENFFTYDKKIKIMTSEERNKNKINWKIVPITVFENTKKFNDIILSSGDFISFCPHHLVPFFGKYYFAYLPNKFIIGKSKIDSVVKYFCGRFNLQEQLTNNIASWSHDNLKSQGVMLIMKAKHLCEYLTTDKISEMTTSAVRGRFLKEQTLKDEVLKLIGVV